MKKKSLIILAFFILNHIAYSQISSSLDYEKLVQKGNICFANCQYMNAIKAYEDAINLDQQLLEDRKRELEPKMEKSHQCLSLEETLNTWGISDEDIRKTYEILYQLNPAEKYRNKLIEYAIKDQWHYLYYNDVSLYEINEFITNYPQTEYAKSLENKKLQIQSREEWEYLNNKEVSIDELNNFIKNYPNSEYIEDAKRKIEELRYQLKKKEYSAWQKAQKENTIYYYEQYLKIYPNGEYSNLAKLEISKIKDHKEWSIAVSKHTIDAFKHYIQLYPNGEYIDKAHQCITEIEDKNAWDYAVQQNTISAYQTYINNGGLKKEEAKKAINKKEQQDNYIKIAQDYFSNENYILAYENIKKAESLGKLPSHINIKYYEEEFDYIKIAKSKDIYTIRSFISKYPNSSHNVKLSKKLNRLYANIEFTEKTTTFSHCFLEIIGGYNIQEESFPIGFNLGVQTHRIGGYTSLKYGIGDESLYCALGPSFRLSPSSSNVDCHLAFGPVIKYNIDYGNNLWGGNLMLRLAPASEKKFSIWSGSLGIDILQNGEIIPTVGISVTIGATAVGLALLPFFLL
jgi:outer membrane protein assembly factor BamD (BamD/ComL family)